MQTRAARRALAAAQPIPVDGDDVPVNLVTNSSLADHENIWHIILSHLAAPNVSNVIKAPCTGLLRLSGVCRGWRDGFTPMVWRQLCMSRWPSTSHVEVQDYKKYFRSRSAYLRLGTVPSADATVDQLDDGDPIIRQLKADREELIEALEAQMAADATDFSPGASHVVSQPYADPAFDGLICLIDITVNGEPLISRAFPGGTSVLTLLQVMTVWRGNGAPMGVELLCMPNEFGVCWTSDQIEEILPPSKWAESTFKASCALYRPSTNRVMVLMDSHEGEVKMDPVSETDGAEYANASKYKSGPSVGFGLSQDTRCVCTYSDYAELRPSLFLLSDENQQARVSLNFILTHQAGHLVTGPLEVRDILHRAGMTSALENIMSRVKMARRAGIDMYEY